MSKSDTNTVFARQYNPIQLGIFAAVGYTIVCIVKWLIDRYGGSQKPEFFWLTGAAFLFVFITFTCLYYIGTRENMRYWKQSLIAYSGLLIWIIVGSRIFSGIPIDQAASFRWIYAVLTFSFFIFLGITSVVKYLIGIAEKDDWQEPKTRGKSKK